MRATRGGVALVSALLLIAALASLVAAAGVRTSLGARAQTAREASARAGYAAEACALAAAARFGPTDDAAAVAAAWPAAIAAEGCSGHAEPGDGYVRFRAEVRDGLRPERLGRVDGRLEPAPGGWRVAASR